VQSARNVDMLTFLVEMNFAPRESEAASQLLASLVGPTEAKTGCRACSVSRDAIDGGCVRYSETWDTERAFRRHVQSEEFRLVLTAIDMCSEEPTVLVGSLSGRSGVACLREWRETKSDGNHSTVELNMPEAHANLPEGKRTTLGLYVTAKEAYEKWRAEPENVKIIDVRTVEEYLFVGHPEMAWKIPVAVQVYQWDAGKKQFPMKPLPDFPARVSMVAKPGDTLMVMCRSGGRSAIAANMLAKAGFACVYNIVDGMEGDGNGDSAGAPQGGWKNSGCPWTKKLTPERMVLPKAPYGR
jgi:rhodanese-related sulfurtransferase/quinol monooxygenase YgiN